MEITRDFSREALGQALNDDDVNNVIGALQVIGRRGAVGSVSTLGCADLVAACTRRPEAAVVAAAIECLGHLREEGANFKDECVAALRHNDVQVRLASAQALGLFGTSAKSCSAELARLLEDKQDDVKAAAIHALGLVKAEGQANDISKHLDAESLSVVSAACMALGHLGEAGKDKASVIAAKLDEGSLRFSAMTALATMGPSVTSKFLDEIIAKCLVDKDLWCRQAAVAAISQARESAKDSQVEKIVALLKHEEPGVRCVACLAFGGLREKGKAHVNDILAVLKSDDGEDKSNLANQMGGTRRIPAQFRVVRVAALTAIGFLRDGNFVAECADHFSDKNWEVRFQALEATEMLGDDAASVASHVAELLDDGVYFVRAKACEVLGRVKANQHIEKIVELFEDKCPSVRVAAVYAVGQMGEEATRHSTAVFKLLSDVVNQVRAAACRALGSMGLAGRSYAGVIAKILSENDPDLRVAALETLGKLGAHGEAFADEIAECLRDESSDVRQCATQVLESFSGEARHGEEE